MKITIALAVVFALSSLFLQLVPPVQYGGIMAQQGEIAGPQTLSGLMESGGATGDTSQAVEGQVAAPQEGTQDTMQAGPGQPSVDVNIPNQENPAPENVPLNPAPQNPASDAGQTQP